MNHFPLLLCLLLLTAGAMARPVVITVVGVPGEEDYRVRFDGWAQQIERGLAKASGNTLVKTIGAKGGATRQELDAAIAEAARTVTADDPFTLILIGHGSFDGSDYKFNLKGPDITATQLAVALDQIRSQRQLIVNSTSCSGGSLAALVKPKRVVMAATRTGTQKNATIFGRYFADAFSDASADTDKNETVSALEAFQYAQRRTVEYFEQEKRIATEQAVLNDIGSGTGVRDPGRDNGQGLLAAAFPVLRLGATATAAADPAKADLLRRKEILEQQIDRLKYEKDSLAPADYRQRMNALLLTLARTQADIDK
ncbi:MAG: hypothetical protein MUF01_03290 [Bryobacterales bacterium]|jgi:hypothetical protein|nr:hypothetical protein [Bryobacterales bacterium]